MATRDQLYQKFGVAAEAAQLFETELGTLMFGARTIENSWHVTQNSDEAKKALEEISSFTLGRLIKKIQKHITFDDDLEVQLQSALSARNRLFHGFFEKHNFKIQTNEGRDKMIEDLETLHSELFNAWQIAGAMTTAMTSILSKSSHD